MLQKIKMAGYFILFFTIFYSWLAAQNFAADFRVAISSDKASYIEGESIWIKVAVANLSTAHNEIYDLTKDGILSGKLLDFIIKNSQDEHIAFVREPADDWPKITLNGNDSVYNYFDLTNYYGKSITDPYLARRYLPEDSYQCTATFKLDRRSAGIASNTITFKVKQAPASELVVFQNFIRAYTTWLLDYNEGEAISIYRHILVQNPQSVFASLSDYYLNKIIRLSDQPTKDGIEASIAFMDKYPDSPFAYKLAKLVISDAYQNNRLETAAERINSILPKLEIHFPGIIQLINTKISQYQ
jgi:hypothetical protein